MQKPEQKIWGQTQELYRDDMISVHRITVDAGGFCSLHYHAERNNLFHVHRGFMAVLYVKNDRVQTQLLRAGDQFTVPAATCT